MVLCKVEPNQHGKGRGRFRISALRLLYLDAGVSSPCRPVNVDPL